MEINTKKSILKMRERSVEGLITYYNSIYYPTMQFPIHLIPIAKAIVDKRIDKLGVIIGPGSGKALHPNTEILMANNTWKKLIDLEKGELVKTPLNTITPVIDIIHQPPSHLYRLEFEDGRVLYANAQHLWKVGDIIEDVYKIVNTTTLIQNKNTMMIPVTESITQANADLPFSPMFIGWFIKNYTKFDHVNKFMRVSQIHFPEETKNPEHITSYLIKDNELIFPKALHSMSFEQRIEFLSGIIMSSPHREIAIKNQITYFKLQFHDKQYLQKIQEIIWSVGGKAYLYKRPRKNKYILYFRFPVDYVASKKVSVVEQIEAYKRRCTKNPKDFLISLKSANVTKDNHPSICITLADNEGMFVTRGYIQTHNSQFLSIVIPSWEIGLDPTTTTINISAGENLPQGFLNSVKTLIESNPVYRDVFPNVRPDEERGWSLDKGLFVTGHTKGIPDANYFATGITSSSLTGKHGKLIILDDIHSELNSSTPEQCQKITESYYKTVVGRGDPTGARYIVAGRRWSIHDVYQKLIDSGVWTFMTLPAVRDNSLELYYDVVMPDDAVNVFTEEGVT